MSHYKTIQALGTPHVTHQGIVAMLDDFELAVMLSHLMYWADKTDNPLGVYRSNADWYELFRFKEAKVKKLSDELQKHGLITKTHKRLEHRIYYLFNADEFDRQYEQFANLKNDSSPIAKTKIGEAQKSGLADSENQGSLYTKITTKNTYKDYSKESEYAPTHENEQTHFADEKNPPNPSANKPTSKTSSDKKSTTAKKHLTADDLVAVGVSEQVASDYLATRKTKLTQTALDGIIKQANLANIPLDTAIRFTIEQGWQSFKAEWYANRQEKQPKPTWQTPKPNRKSELQALASVYGDDFYSRNSQTPAQNYQDPQNGVNHE